ncbi:M16 family metallopeptidase [Patescibacteria group bacterium]
MVKKTYTKLSNGLPFLFIEIPHTKSSAVSYWSKGGNRFNPKGKEGLAHLLEHLLLIKTKKYNTKAKLATKLESMGAFHNGFTGPSHIVFTIDCAAKDTEIVTGVLDDIVNNPFIDEKGIRSERKVIEKEIARSKSSPGSVAYDKWAEIFLGNSPLQHSTLGTKKSLSKLSIDDCKNHWKKEVINNESMLAISAGKKFEDIIDVAEKTFGQVKLHSQTIPRFMYISSKDKIFKYKDLPQTNILLGFRTIGGPVNDEFNSLSMLRNILGVGWSSRLQKRMREKESLVYSWGAKNYNFFDTGAFVIYLATERNKLSKLLTVLADELSILVKNGVTKDELKLYKGYYEGVMLSRMQKPWDYLNYYGDDELYWPNTLETIEERVEKIKKLTKGDVDKVINKYITNDNWYLSVVGGNKKEEIKFNLVK